MNAHAFRHLADCHMVSGRAALDDEHGIELPATDFESFQHRLGLALEFEQSETELRYLAEVVLIGGSRLRRVD